MIERKFVSQNIRELQVKEYLFKELSRVGLSNVKMQRTPLGEKIVVTASRPGLVVGKGGGNITRLTEELKKKFKLENPQIEIEEVVDPRQSAAIIAEMIVNSLERFGSARFKGIAHQAMSDVIASGALGVEILISGKVPSTRAKTWRFYQGYLKKCGDISVVGVDSSILSAKLKSGVIGVQVRIMPATTVLPDKITFIDEVQTLVEEVKDEKSAEEDVTEESSVDSQEEKPKKKARKKQEVKASDSKEKKPRKRAAKKNAEEELK